MSAAFEEHDYIGLSEVPSMEKTKKRNLQFSATSSALNLDATELRLGLPGSGSERDQETAYGHLVNISVSGAKRGFDGSEKVEFFTPRGATGGSVHKQPLDGSDLSAPVGENGVGVLPKPVPDKKPQTSAPAAKAHVVGWPPIRSFRKNTMTQKKNDDAESKLGLGCCLYVKVSMDGAPYLRKIDLKIYGSYAELSSALEKMFSCFTIGQCSNDGMTENRLMNLLHGSEYVLTYEDKDGDWMLVGDVPWNMFTDSCKRLRIMKSSEAIGLAPRAMEKCKNHN